MCDPVTIGIALATTAAGTGLQMKAQSDARKEIQQLRARTDETNDKLMKESQNQQYEAAQEFDPTVFEGANDVQSNKIEERLLSNLSEGFTDFGGSSTPQIVQNAQAQKSGEAKEYSTGLAQALAKLRGFDQNLFNQNINIGRVGEKTQMNSGFMQGNAQALTSDIENVDAGSPFGDFLTAFGGQALGAGFGAPGAPSGSAGPLPTGKMHAGLGKKPPIPASFRG